MTSYGMSGANAPKFKANMTLRAFRSESGLGWEDFNNLWAELCHYINCPANDVLLDRGMAGTSGYDGKLSSITNDILQSGIFGCDRPATWKYGRYEQEPDLPAITDFIHRLTEYAAEGILAQVSSSTTNLQTSDKTKVGAWLTNQVATNWDDYAFVSRPPADAPAFPATTTSRDDGSTIIVKSIDPVGPPIAAAHQSPSCSATSIATARPVGESTLYM